MVKCIDHGHRLNTGSNSCTGSGLWRKSNNLTLQNPMFGRIQETEGNWGESESGVTWTHLILHSAPPHGGPRVVRGVGLGRSTAKVTQLDHPSSTQQQVLHLSNTVQIMPCCNNNNNGLFNSLSGQSIQIEIGT